MDRIFIQFETVFYAKIEDIKLDIERLSFSLKQDEFSLKFAFRSAINPKSVKRSMKRSLELVIEKETSNVYWPHLLNKEEKKKLKVKIFICI